MIKRALLISILVISSLGIYAQGFKAGLDVKWNKYRITGIVNDVEIKGFNTGIILKKKIAETVPVNFGIYALFSEEKYLLINIITRARLEPVIDNDTNWLEYRPTTSEKYTQKYDIYNIGLQFPINVEIPIVKEKFFVYTGMNIYFFKVFVFSNSPDISYPLHKEKKWPSVKKYGLGHQIGFTFYPFKKLGISMEFQTIINQDININMFNVGMYYQFLDNSK